MTEVHRPRLTADHLTAVLSAEMSRHEPPAGTASFSLADLETLLRAAEERARPRTQLPPQLQRFPFTLRPVQQLFLKVYKRLFHDQRAVNIVLIQALRETLAVNRYLLRTLAEQGQVPAPSGLRLVKPVEGGAESCAS